MQKGPKQFQPRRVVTRATNTGRKKRKRSKPQEQLVRKTHMTDVTGMYADKPTSLCNPRTDPTWYHSRNTSFHAGLRTGEIRADPTMKRQHLMSKHPITSEFPDGLPIQFAVPRTPIQRRTRNLISPVIDPRINFVSTCAFAPVNVATNPPQSDILQKSTLSPFVVFSEGSTGVSPLRRSFNIRLPASTTPLQSKCNDRTQKGVNEPGSKPWARMVQRGKKHPPSL